MSVSSDILQPFGINGSHQAPLTHSVQTRANSCNTCLRVTETERCSLCRVASYCSKKCQKAAWKNGHKTVCPRFGRILLGLRVVYGVPNGIIVENIYTITANRVETDLSGMLDAHRNCRYTFLREEGHDGAFETFVKTMKRALSEIGETYLVVDDISFTQILSYAILHDKGVFLPEMHIVRGEGLKDALCDISRMSGGHVQPVRLGYTWGALEESLLRAAPNFGHLSTYAVVEASSERFIGINPRGVMCLTASEWLIDNSLAAAEVLIVASGEAITKDVLLKECTRVAHIIEKCLVYTYTIDYSTP